MAAARSTKKANSEKENHPQDTYYKTNRDACHEVSKKRVCFHSITKSTQWAFFHPMASFYSQFYETILPFFCGKIEMQKIPGSHSWRRSNYPKSPIAKPYRIPMIPIIMPINRQTITYAKNGSWFIRYQNRPHKPFMANSPFVARFMK